jgi:hypothetical protein
MPFCSSQNILVFRVGIKLRLTSRDILKADFVIALNQNLTHSLTPHGDDPNTSSPSRKGGRIRVENDFKDFKKSFDGNIDKT